MKYKLVCNEDKSLPEIHLKPWVNTELKARIAKSTTEALLRKLHGAKLTWKLVQS